MKDKKPKAKRKFLHYWMCDECARKMGGVFPDGHVCTITMGTCEYCEDENTPLIPWVDYDWSDIDTSGMRD